MPTPGLDLETKAVTAEQKADNALAQSQVAIDLNKQLMSEMAELKKIVMDHEYRSVDGSCSVTNPLSHPHYFGHAYFVGNIL
jgi:hypothetical protein